MNISRISLCQNEDWIYDNRPRALDNDYNPCYNFEYPFSFEIALDCERIVYKLKEYDVTSDICWHLVVTFINSNTVQCSKLIDFVDFGQSKMRFVNVVADAYVFNSISLKEKRKYLLDSICSAIILVTNEIYHDTIKKIINEVFESAANTECVYLNRCTKRYNAAVKFKSSLTGYDVSLSIRNNLTCEEQQMILFENCSYADLVYKVHQIIFKGKQCVIKPKNDDRNFDKQIIVDLF